MVYARSQWMASTLWFHLLLCWVDGDGVSFGVCSDVLLSSVSGGLDGAVGFGVCFMLLLVLFGLVPEMY